MTNGGKRFHQNLKIFINRHKVFWDVDILDDDCWSIFKETGRENRKKRVTSLISNFLILYFEFLRFH